MKRPQNIIVRMPNWVGDLVMATPILTDLRNAFPDASITAMCKAPLCELLRDDLAIDELFCFRKPTNQFSKREERRDIIAKIEEGKYDLGILLTHSFSSAWWFWQGGVARRIGYGSFLRNFLLTDKIKRSKEKLHQVDSYKKLLEPLGIPKSHTMPRLFISDNEQEESREILFQRGYRRDRILIGMNPGSAYGPAKCWPQDRFQALAKRLLAIDNVSVVFFGDASGSNLVKSICSNLPKEAMDVAGVTSLRELACLIKECDLLVTNDSGPMHIAAAVGTPVVALFGSTDPEATGPFGQSESVITKRVSCSPCLKRKCPIDFRCMMQISVEEVLQKIRDRLDI